ncbi:MAG TPA: hypothetical protein PK948_04955 [Gemmatimonadales bacterium]|nr:hypothetical protein [Gemmatimonadales bacterium]
MNLKMLALAMALSAAVAAQSLPPQVVTRAGTASTSVVNVQGNASGTPIPVTGTISVAGAADTVGNSATFNANSVCATVLLTGQPGAGFALQAGTLDATLTPSVSEDATPATPGCTGGNYTATKFVTDSAGNTASTLVVTNPNVYTHYGVVTLAGSRCARVCTTTYASGSAAGNLVASVAPSPPPAAGADVTDRAARVLGQLTDGASAITPAKTGQLPTALDGGGYLKVHEQGTATVSGTVTANAGSGTMAVSAAALPLPSGAATAAKQPALGTAGASSTDVLSVQGIASGTALPVSAASLPLPSGASTAAKQPALGTAGTASSDVITVQGITSMTPLKVDNSGVTQPVSGTVAATQSGTWTVQPGNTANTTAWKVDGSAVTQPVSGTVSAAQSGTWNVTNVSGTVSLPTGAATAAKQPALGTAGTASSDVITVQGIASMTALKVDGSAVTQPVSGTFWQATQPVSGSVTVSGTATVSQATGTNLHAVIDSGSTTDVTQATASNLNATVVGGVTNDGGALGAGVATQPAVARASPTAVTAGRGEALQVSTTNGGAFANITGGAGTLVADVQPHNTAATGNGLETMPATGRSAVAASTAGRATSLSTDTTNGSLNIRLTDSATYTGVGVQAHNGAAATSGIESLPGIARSAVSATTAGRPAAASIDTTNGSLNVRLTDSATYLSPGVVANDATAIANGLETQPAVARASPTALTAGRSEKLQVNSADGRLWSSSAFDLSNLTTVSSGLSTATTLTQLIAASGSNKVYIVNWKCSASVAATTTTDQQCTLKYGTGSNCATGTTYLDGCFNPATGGCNGAQIVAPASQAVCWIHAAAGSKIVTITYYQAP